MSLKTIYDFSARDIQGNEVSMSDFKGKTVLIVNVASQCGFTPQYEDLENLYDKYKDKGFVVLGFPCNQFGSQEPGSEKEIQAFCEVKFGVKFPMFSKVDVNGPDAHPLFNFLKEELPGIMGSTGIKWNFTKFLVNKDGIPLKRYAPKEKPSKFEHEIVENL